MINPLHSPQCLSGSFRWFSFAVFWLVAIPALAQDLAGPVYPCPDCEQRRFRPEPVQSMWYNPQQSGTGMTFTIRNHHLVGTWYGYDAQGNPEWLLFNAQMQPGETPEILWTLDANLKRYLNGSCPTCAYQPPQAPEIVGQIHIEFDQLAHARYTVTKGGETTPVQNIVPLRYGGTVYTPIGNSGLDMPDMQGQWWFVYQYADSNGENIKRYRRNEIREFSENQPLTHPQLGDVVGNSRIAATSPENVFAENGVVCDDGSDVAVTWPAPFCLFQRLNWTESIASVDIDFKLPVGNVLHNRLVGEGENFFRGDMLVEAFRFNLNRFEDAEPSFATVNAVAPMKLSPVPPPAPGPSHRINPVQGMWFDPDEPGTGFTFYVQNRHLIGAYYGYEEDGEPMWLVFDGPMQPGDRDAHEIWTVQGNLVRYAGGQCLGCAYQPPASHETVGTVELTFTQMKNVCLQINWNQQQINRCLSAGEFGGVPRIVLDPDFPNIVVPSLAGEWLVVLRKSPDAYPEYLYGLWNYDSKVLQLDAPQWIDDGAQLKVANLTTSTQATHWGIDGGTNMGEMKCSAFAEMALYKQPICSIRWQWPAPSTIISDGEEINLDLFNNEEVFFTLYQADIDENHFFAESEEGHLIEGFKLTTERIEAASGE